MQAQVQDLEAELAESKAIIAQLLSEQQSATGQQSVVPSATLPIACTRRCQISYFPWQVSVQKPLPDCTQLRVSLTMNEHTVT